jgi:uncharacterized protein YcfJ
MSLGVRCIRRKVLHAERAEWHPRRDRPELLFRSRRGEVVVGAVVGALAAMKDAGSGNREDATTAAVLGAVGGGTAASVGPFIREQIAAVGVPAYLATDDPA